MADERYFASGTGEEERLRLRGLELLYDPTTRRRLEAAGLRKGHRCLELGAGGGSVARMLAELSGTRVVAVDMDPRFLDLDDARYEVRKLDVTRSDAFGDEQFDVIHCRLLMMHLSDPPALLRTLKEHLTPGGFLLAEEPNMLTWAPADPTAPGAEPLQRVITRALEATEAAGVWRNRLGPRMSTLFEAAGLSDVTSDGACWIAPDGRPEIMALMVQSLELIAVHGVAAGALTEDEVRAAIDRVRSRALRQVTPTIFGTVGRRAA